MTRSQSRGYQYCGQRRQRSRLEIIDHKKPIKRLAIPRPEMPMLQTGGDQRGTRLPWPYKRQIIKDPDLEEGGRMIPYPDSRTNTNTRPYPTPGPPKRRRGGKGDVPLPKLPACSLDCYIYSTGSTLLYVVVLSTLLLSAHMSI